MQGREAVVLFCRKSDSIGDATVHFMGLLLAILMSVAIIFLTNLLIKDFQMTSAWAPFATLGVAVAAVWLAIWQQHKITERELEARERKARAAKAVLPLALSKLCAYAKQSVEALRMSYPTEESASVSALMDLPDDTIRVFQD